MEELFGGCVFISLFKMKKRIHTFGQKKWVIIEISSENYWLARGWPQSGDINC